MYSIYSKSIVNYKQFTIDNLPYRKKVNARKVFYLKPASRRCKCMHITQDYHDKAKHLRTMAQHIVNYNEVKTYYYIDTTRKEIRKLKDYTRKHKHEKIDYNYIYYGTKTQAQKRLVKMI